VPAYAYTAVNRLSTEIASLSQVQIETNIQETLVKNAGWLNGSICDYRDVPGVGTVYQVPQEPGLTMTQTSESGTAGMGDVSAAWTLTSRQITAYLYAVDIPLTKVALEAHLGNIQPYIIKAGQRAAIKAIETVCCATYTEAPSSGPDHEIGTAGTPPDWALLTAGMELLMVQEAEGPYTAMFHTTDWSALSSIPELNEAQIVGRGVIENGLDTMTGKADFGTKNLNIFLTNRVTQSGGNRNFMFDRNAIGVRMKENFKVAIDATRLDVGERALFIGMEIWFGAGGIRNTPTTNAYMVELLT